MSEEMDLRLAVLIDADNAPRSALGDVMAEIAVYGTPTIKRIYGDWTTPNLASWKPLLLENAITPVQQYSYTTGKNSTDSAMIIDAMDILYTGQVDGFVLVSSDSDFTRLAIRLREAGKKVYGMGEKKTPNPFIVACDKFVYIEVIRSAAEQARAEEAARAAAQAPKPKKSKKKAEDSAPAPQPEPEPAARVPQDIVTLIADSVEMLADEDGYAPRLFADEGVAALVAASSSKNFALYGQRAGALHVLTRSNEEKRTVESILKSLVRSTYSNPPKFAGSVVAEVLADPELEARWRKEVDEMRERMVLMRRLFAEAGERHGVDPLLACAVIQCESGWDEDVVSSAGAVGLMQVMPIAAETMVLQGIVDPERWDPDALADPEVNIEYGCATLGYLQDQLSSLDETIAAYNAGLGAVQGWIDEGGSIPEDIEYAETRAYVERVREAYEGYRQSYPDGITEG